MNARRFIQQELFEPGPVACHWCAARLTRPDALFCVGTSCKRNHEREHGRIDVPQSGPIGRVRVVLPSSCSSTPPGRCFVQRTSPRRRRRSEERAP